MKSWSNKPSPLPRLGGGGHSIRGVSGVIFIELRRWHFKGSMVFERFKRYSKGW